MAAVKNLDLLTGAPIDVELQGQTYKLPPDISIADMLTLDALRETAAGDDAKKAQRATQEYYERVLRLFRVHQPGIEEVPLSISQLFLFHAFVYGDLDPAAVSGDADPPPPAAGTRNATRKKARAKSRTSSRSSRA